MEKYAITPGDFLKNAGIVGMKYILDCAKAQEGVDFGISEDGQEMWLNCEFIQNADWTSLYFQACVQNFGRFTVYQGVMEKIKCCIGKIQNEKWNPGKNEKDDLKFINDKLLSNSYQAGFENIKDQIEHPEVYITLKKEKLIDKMTAEELLERLSKLQVFLEQEKCKETFIMKSVVYNYINRFWDGKSFLLRSNAKKDMREQFEKDFSEPFRKYFMTDHTKAKDLCIDCGEPVTTKEKVFIAFMKEVGDDFTRKRSAFWNCNVDAFLCPVCTFLYAASPLGFRLFANKFVFVNNNSDMFTLLAANSKNRKSSLEGEKEENQRYSQWFAETLNIILNEKRQELSNIQVILRGTGDKDRYKLSIINKDILNILKREDVEKALKNLGQYPFTKIRNDFVNVHEQAVMNLLGHQNQYILLDSLLREAIAGNAASNFHIHWVYEIQKGTEISYKKEEEKEVLMYCISMKKSGSELRKAIMTAKKDTTGDSLRGIEYQLLNALSVKNTEKFMDIVARLYSSYGSEKLLIPNGMIRMLQDKEKFSEYGYAFVLGLIGCYEGKKEVEQ